jgi:hypothetical protein
MGLIYAVCFVVFLIIYIQDLIRNVPKGNQNRNPKKIVSVIICALSVVAGLTFLNDVKTDVGIICSVILLQCGWIVLLLGEIVKNTAKAK